MIKNVKDMSRMAGNLLSAVLLSAVFILGASCSESVKEDMEALFNNVPADASIVISGNLSKIVDQCGGEVKDGRIVSFGKDGMLSAFGKSKGMAQALDEFQKIAKTVKAGACVGFSYKGESYLTCELADASEFKKIVDAKYPGAWDKSGNVEYKGNYAVADGDRLWIGDALSVEKVAELMKLSDTQSFLSCKYSSRMADSDKAMDIWMSLDALYSTLSFSKQTQARMVASMLFETPKFLTGNVEFRKDGTAISLMPVTADYKPAKCVIDVAAIDVDKVASLGGNANMIVAVAVSQKLVKQIQDLGSSMGGALPKQMWDIISPLDGTIAFASQEGEHAIAGVPDGFRGIVSTNGVRNAALGQLLEGFATVKIEGNDFNLSKGSYGDGIFDVASVAKKMKGAWLSVAYGAKENGKDVKVLLLLEPSEGSLRLKTDVSAQ